MSERLVLMRGITGRLGRLEESQTSLMKSDKGSGGNRDKAMYPPRHLSLFVLALGRGTIMPIFNLEGSIDAPMFTTRRPFDRQMPFGHWQPY